MINVNFGDYDLVQVSKNEFKKAFHENVQGTEKTFFLLDKDVKTVESIIEEIENTDDSDARFSNIDYIEREYLI